MEETDFHTAPETPEKVAEAISAMREVLAAQRETLELILKSLESNTDALRIVSDTTQRAAPLLESRAAKIALGIERHPILNLPTRGPRRG